MKRLRTERGDVQALPALKQTDPLRNDLLGILMRSIDVIATRDDNGELVALVVRENLNTGNEEEKARRGASSHDVLCASLRRRVRVCREEHRCELNSFL